MAVDTDLIKERVFSSTTNSEKDEDNYWKVVLICSEKIVANDGETYEESISFMGINTSFKLAHETALSAYLNWMESFVYSKGSDSLIEGVINEKAGREDASISKNN